MATARPSPGDPPKRRRVTQACDYCHHRSIRCRPADIDDRGRCANCSDFDQLCTRDRVVKRRGTKPRREQGREAAVNPSTSPLTVAAPAPSSCSPSASLSTSTAWSAPHAAAQAVIVDLIEVYFEVVYPIFPLFHRASFLRKISRGEYAHNQSLFAVTMAACSLTSARVRDNALFNPAWDKESLIGPTPDAFHGASVSALPKSGSPEQSLDVMRAYALLALAALQHGRTREMQAFLGRYHTMVAMDGLHDESNWPQGLSIIETEERRRLYWSMYTLDVFSCLVFDSLIRTREEQSHVRYPTELDDSFFDNAGYREEHGTFPGTTGSSTVVCPASWLHGYNITTDLWRLLEHVTIKLNGRRRKKKCIAPMAAKLDMSPSTDSLQAEIDRIYFSLPSHFLVINEMTGNHARDLYGFQAANIVATMQLLRMVLLSSEENTIEQRCQVVSEVVDAFTRIPTSYLRAISCPLLHHLGGIGSVLGGVLEEALDLYQYQQVRTVLLSLAQLLENLDLGLHSVQSAERLRTLVSQVDAHMASKPADEARSSASLQTMQHGDIHISEDFLIDWPWKSSFT